MEMRNETTVTSQIWNFKGKVPFVDDWFLMTTPVPVSTILLSYLLVLKVGPEYMKTRPALNLNKLLVVYNAVQVIVSAYLFIKGFSLIQPYGLIHKTCLLNNEHFMFMVTQAIYHYLAAKVSELLDTLFFILRKKKNQLTFLHVYHHFSMVLFPWIFLKFEPSYSVVFLGTVNSFIHILMYTYYGLAAFPSLAKYLWWKKYITSMQLIQFVLVILHILFDYAYGGCRPSYYLFTVILFNAIFYVYLFGNFYIKSYVKRKSA